MPTFCPQCGSTRPEATCPIHGSSEHPSGVFVAEPIAPPAPRPQQVAPQRPEDRPALPPSLSPQRVTRSLPRPISTVMDPLQPLPRRPKKTAMGAWLLAIGLAVIAAVVLWLNVRPRRVSLQDRVEEARDGAKALWDGAHGDGAATDPAVRKATTAQPGAPASGDRALREAQPEPKVKGRSTKR